MRKVTYKRLKIQNFLSIGNDSVEIEFQSGLNLITGINIDNPERRNGIGKSVIIEAFYYALYGKALRKIKLDFVVNNVTKGKGLIELEFDVETDTTTKSYKIVRQIKPSKVELWENDVDITKDSIKNESKFINNLIGSNDVLCKSCDILSLNDNVPFMAKSPEEKKKFIEDILSLEVFGKMLKELKELIKNNKTDMNISSAKVGEIDKSLELLEKQKEAFQFQVGERAKVLQSRRENLEEQIQSVETSIEAYVIPDTVKLEENKKKLENAVTKLEERIQAIDSERSQVRTEKRIKQNEIEKASSVAGATCDKCLQDIPHSHIEHLITVRTELNNRLGALDAQESGLDDDRSKCVIKWTPVKSKIKSIELEIQKATTDRIKLTSLEEKLSQYKRSLSEMDEDSVQQDTPIFEDSITETQERLSKESESLEYLKQNADDYDSCKFILGEEGVKSFVVKRLLSMLNTEIQKYITTLGMSMRCKFDEYFDEQITNNKGKEICYWNLSGAERKTVDFACAWAFKDLKRKISGVSSNVEFHDEIYDTTLCTHGVDLLIEVVKDRIQKDNLSVYAISHRSELMKHLNEGEIIQLEMENGLTRRVFKVG